MSEKVDRLCSRVAQVMEQQSIQEVKAKHCKEDLRKRMTTQENMPDKKISETKSMVGIVTGILAIIGTAITWIGIASGVIKLK